MGPCAPLERELMGVKLASPREMVASDRASHWPASLTNSNEPRRIES